MKDTGSPSLVQIDLISVLPVVFCLVAGIGGYWLVDFLHLNAANLQAEEKALDAAISLTPTRQPMPMRVTGWQLPLYFCWRPVSFPSVRAC